MEKGLSGGVSALGTGSALVSSFALMSIPLLLGAIPFKAFLFIGILAFLGTLVDSVAGALFQSLYRCDACGNQVENAIHCGSPATLIKGFRMIDNVAVNYIAGFVTCAMGVILIFV